MGKSTAFYTPEIAGRSARYWMRINALESHVISSYVNMM